MNRFLRKLKPVVLIVDDSPANIHILAESLQEEYDVLVATRGLQALEIAFRDPQPDVILLDMVMPEMNGHEVCRALKEDDRTRNIPVIFVTADVSWETEQQSFELGAVDYVTKPFSIPVVRARVRTHVTLKLRTDILEHLAQIDGLTGIANRRSFDKAFASEWQRCARQDAPLSLILADVDHFKAYNDTYGHGAGDKCLRGIARIMEEHAARTGDLAARFGGEEFALLLPFTSHEGAMQVAERLRARIAEWVIDSGTETARRVTISTGCATMHPTTGTDENVLSRAADDLLYKAKNEGRNRVCGEEVVTA